MPLRRASRTVRPLSEHLTQAARPRMCRHSRSSPRRARRSRRCNHGRRGHLVGQTCQLGTDEDHRQQRRRTSRAGDRVGQDRRSGFRVRVPREASGMPDRRTRPAVPRIHQILPGRGAGLLRSQRTRIRGGGELDWRYHVSSAASNAPAIAGLLLPARTASPMAMRVCPGFANALKRSAVPRRAR
jgi:hypothetical protein